MMKGVILLFLGILMSGVGAVYLHNLYEAALESPLFALHIHSFTDLIFGYYIPDDMQSTHWKYDSDIDNRSDINYYRFDLHCS